MSKAKSVFVCAFTNTPPDGWLGTLPSPDLVMYEAISNAANELFVQEGIEGTVVSPCYAKAPEFQDFLKTANQSVPFISVIGTFPDGTKKFYVSKSASNIKNAIRAMWKGEFGGTDLPTNPGDGDGGWGQGDGGLLCRLIPPLCALGFLPWLALAAVATYKTAESRSTTGKIMWGAPATLLWLGFFERGGVKQIQWWLKKINPS